MSVTRLRVRLTFTGESIKQPLIYELGHRFPIVTNIRWAEVKEHVGYVHLELDGEEEALKAGIEWLRERGVQVELVAGDVVEG